MPNYPDTELFIVQTTDPTRQIRFDLSALSTPDTVRSIAVPDVSVNDTLPLCGTTNTWSGAGNTFANGATFQGGVNVGDAFNAASLLLFAADTNAAHRIQMDGASATGTRTVVWQDKSGTVPLVVGTADLTAQTGDIAATTLLASAPVGMYRMDVVIVDETSGGGSLDVEALMGATVLPAIPFWDDGSSAFVNGVGLNGQPQFSASLNLYNASVQDLKYEVNHVGTVQYAVHVRLIALT